jgi:hypothetical protein
MGFYTLKEIPHQLLFLIFIKKTARFLYGSGLFFCDYNCINSAPLTN